MFQEKASLVERSGSKQTIGVIQQNKDEKINEARAMKHYLMSRKSKQLAERDESARTNQLSNMNDLRSGMRERKEAIN